MSFITTYRSNTSRRVVSTSHSSQYHDVSEHEHSFQHRLASQPQHLSQNKYSSIHQTSNKPNACFGPVRSSSARNQPQSFTASCAQHRTLPYTTNSPRTNRRQHGTVCPDVDASLDHNEDENVQRPHSITMNQNTFDKLIERYNSLEHEMHILQAKTDRLLKIVRRSNYTQDNITSKPKVNPNPVFWNNQNLLSKNRSTLPTTYLCDLVRTMYTPEEIKDKVSQIPPEVGDERPNKIKVISYFRYEIVEDKFFP